MSDEDREQIEREARDRAARELREAEAERLRKRDRANKAHEDDDWDPRKPEERIEKP